MCGTVRLGIVLTLVMAIGGGSSWAFGQEAARSTMASVCDKLIKPVVTGRPFGGFTNEVGMEFKLIPAGEFMMGSDKGVGELDRSVSSFSLPESPQHRVRALKPFYMGVTEVTQAQYEKVMGRNPSYFSTTEQVATAVSDMRANCPVETVSWHDAADFCVKLSDGKTLTYRLPTEAEWEYACRAGGSSRYCFGENEKHLDDYAWWGAFVVGASCLQEKHTHRVGWKKKNHFGLYDMHGNVSEWCSDWYSTHYYAKSPLSAPAGPATGSHRVYRGGSWYSLATNCRSAYRAGYVPAYRSSDLGFRVVAVPRTRIGDEPDRVPFESAQGDRQAGWLRYLAAGHVMERAF